MGTMPYGGMDCGHRSLANDRPGTIRSEILKSFVQRFGFRPQRKEAEEKRGGLRFVAGGNIGWDCPLSL